MRTPQQQIALFVSLLLVLLLVLIVIYDCDDTYDETETIKMECMSTYKFDLLSCPCPSDLPRIINTLVYTNHICIVE